MSIVVPPITPPTPPVLPLDKRQAALVFRIKNRNTQLLNTIVQVITANMTDVWSNPDQTNFSPQQVFTLFGTDAGSLVSASATLIALVNSQVPDSLPATPPKPLTVNPDGTVTVGS